MKKTKKPQPSTILKPQAKDYLLWSFGKKVFRCLIVPRPCPICRADGTLVGLPAPILKKQPDKTNVVCHPAFGGCNHGFELDIDFPLYRELLEGTFPRRTK